MSKTRLAALAVVGAQAVWGATTLVHYYAHPAVADKHGVIAPWYKGQNGQFDYRVRIAAETLKRYPWAPANRAIAPAPEYVYNGTWSIDHEGRIQAIEEKDWNNGDLGQRASYILSSLIDYYAYSGDPAVFTHITAMADYLVNYCQTEPSHGWPNMLISVPTFGVRYGRCRLGTSDELPAGQGKIQLDNMAQVALELVRAYEMTGNTRWYEAAKHWADLLAQNRNRQPGKAPWGRYANNASGAGMNDIQTGGVTVLLALFDELIRTGYRGANNSIVEAREAGRAYLRDVLLPAWTLQDIWGRNFWDWECPVQDLFGTEYAALYMMNNKDAFPNWANDVRNILTLFVNHALVSPSSNGEVFHGAWAYPESSGCCARSLWYSPMELAALFARYGVEAASPWAREIARRSQLLATYDPRSNGESMDLIDGGNYVNKSWFKIAHPMALKYVLRTMGWLPEIMGPNRENHIMRSSGVIKKVAYGKGRIAYSTYDGGEEVLRLSFKPDNYPAIPLANGDYIVTIKHPAAAEIVITGPDPQTQTAVPPGSPLNFQFTGNQVRLVGRVSPSGGLADVFVDDFKQLTPIDFHSPIALSGQILFARSGLTQGQHSVRVVPRKEHNPLSSGSELYVDAVQYSGAQGDSGFGEGGGPTDTQRLLFGYTGRTDFVDSKGNSWKPGMEFIARTGDLTDAVAKSWWTMRQAYFVTGTQDPELYRYGAHWKDLTINLTVGPGAYHVRLKFAETQYRAPRERGITISINGQRAVEGLDVLATAGAPNKAVDLVYNDIKPRNGVIEIRLVGEPISGRPSEAMIQAIEIGPGDGGAGATPKTVF